MSSLFNYSTLQVSLEKETKTLKILLNRPENRHAINTEMIFELESVFAWATNKIEIDSIYISSTKCIDHTVDLFSCGIDHTQFHRFNQEKFQKLLSRIRKIIFACFHLPQTIIIDYKDGAEGIAAELGIGADIRLASDQTKLNFNHLNLGHTPLCGGIAYLSKIVPSATAKSWLLSASDISISSLQGSGYISELHSQENRSQKITSLLKNINAQAPVQRIQCKNALNMPILQELRDNALIEDKTANSSLATADWHEGILAKLQNRDPEFMSTKSFAEVAREASRNISPENHSAPQQ